MVNPNQDAMVAFRGAHVPISIATVREAVAAAGTGNVVAATRMVLPAPAEREALGLRTLGDAREFLQALQAALLATPGAPALPRPHRPAPRRSQRRRGRQ